MQVRQIKLSTFLFWLSCVTFVTVLAVWVTAIVTHGYLLNPRFLRVHFFYWTTGALLAGIGFAWLVTMARRARSKERTLVEANRELTETQEKIKRLICLAEEKQSFWFRFENPKLVRCYEVKNCDRLGCPVYGKMSVRCWQIVGTHCPDRRNASFSEKMRNCPECIVYKTSCPDKFSELAEDFNNLMAMLQRKDEELSAVRRQAILAEKRAVAGEIAAGLAHEINNPLDGLKNCILRIQKNPAETTQTRQYLNLMMDGLNRIERVMAQLLDLTREHEYHYTKADLNSVLDSTLGLLSMKGQDRGIVIEKVYSSRLPQIEADVPSLQQVFLNLELNALAAMPMGGTLSVRTREAGSSNDGTAYVEAEISDTGEGIPAENLDKVFKPFFTTKEPGKGTGLGLSISRNIVEEHNGEIRVRSGVGRGTCFIVRLPVGQQVARLDLLTRPDERNLNVHEVSAPGKRPSSHNTGLATRT